MDYRYYAFLLPIISQRFAHVNKDMALNTPTWDDTLANIPYGGANSEIYHGFDSS